MTKLTQKRLKELLHYNPLTGIFTWKIINCNRASSSRPAGHHSKSNYITIGIDGKKYRAHKLVWLYVHGYFPENEIDHNDGKGYNNKLNNLREAAHLCNMQNQKLRNTNTSGFNGVSLNKSRSKFIANIMINGIKITIGQHVDPISAALARVAFEDACDKWSCDHRAVNRVKLRTLGFQV